MIYTLSQMVALLSTKIDGSATTTTTSSSSGGFLSGLFGNSGLVVVLYCVVIFGIVWLMSKPGKKKQQAMEEQRNKIKPGDPVVLKSGIYGTVVEVTAECFIVEFGMNRGVRIPIMKEAISTVREPNLSDTPTPQPVKEKRGLFGRKKVEEPQKEEVPEKQDVTDETK